MHRIWISRNSSIPVREQLSAQILYGILSRRLGPAERLPSVRDLARRLKVHPNTVSAAYRDLAARGWVKAKTGSGVFVREIDHRGKAYGIDAFVEAWVQEAAGRGFSLDALSAVLEKIRREADKPASPQALLVIHPDRNLARILAAEIEEAVGCGVDFAGLKDAPPALETFRVHDASGGRSCRAIPRSGAGAEAVERTDRTDRNSSNWAVLPPHRGECSGPTHRWNCGL